MNQKNIEKSTTEKALDEFSDEMLNSAINGINEAVATKQKEVDFWKRQAYILHGKKGQCRDCKNKTDTKNADLYFETGGADCIECPDEDNNKNPKEIIKMREITGRTAEQ